MAKKKIVKKRIVHELEVTSWCTKEGSGFQEKNNDGMDAIIIANGCTSLCNEMPNGDVYYPDKLDIPNVDCINYADVFLYYYQPSCSGINSAKFDFVQYIQHILAEREYENIYLVGHSNAAIVCALAIHDLFEWLSEFNYHDMLIPDIKLITVSAPFGGTPIMELSTEQVMRGPNFMLNLIRSAVFKGYQVERDISVDSAIIQKLDLYQVKKYIFKNYCSQIGSLKNVCTVEDFLNYLL